MTPRIFSYTSSRTPRPRHALARESMRIRRFEPKCSCLDNGRVNAWKCE